MGLEYKQSELGHIYGSLLSRGYRCSLACKLSIGSVVIRRN